MHFLILSKLVYEIFFREQIEKMLIFKISETPLVKGPKRNGILQIEYV